MKRKNWFILVMAWSLLAVLSGCERTAPSQSDVFDASGSQSAVVSSSLPSSSETAGSEASESQAVSDVAVEIAHQFENGSSTLALPKLTGDDSGDVWKINREIEELYQSRYWSFEHSAEEMGWCEVSYDVSDTSRYLSVVVLHQSYPIYGTDGGVCGWVYDKQTRREVSLQQALEMAGTSIARIEQQLDELLADENAQLAEGLPDVANGGLMDAAFRIREDGQPEFYLSFRLDNPAADPWNTFYFWSDGVLTKGFETAQ